MPWGGGRSDRAWGAHGAVIGGVLDVVLKLLGNLVDDDLGNALVANLEHVTSSALAQAAADALLVDSSPHGGSSPMRHAHTRVGPGPHPNAHKCCTQ